MRFVDRYGKSAGVERVDEKEILAYLRLWRREAGTLLRGAVSRVAPKRPQIDRQPSGGSCSRSPCNF